MVFLFHFNISRDRNEQSQHLGKSLLEGLWTFAVPSIETYGWGRTGLETLFGCVLELPAPKTIWDGYPGALQHNARIAGA